MGGDHGGHGGDKKFKGEAGSATALIAASGCAGVSELLIFHPIDTTAKRLMSYQKKVFGGEGSAMATLNKVIFKEAANKSFMGKWGSLFPGLGFAFAYKVSQRIYKFGGQPVANDYVNKYIGDALRKKFGEKQGKPLTNAISGMFIGIGEIVILPFDVLKIKKQTNPEAFANRSIVNIFFKDFFTLYAGGLWTAVRNAFGSFSLFGASVCVKEYVFQLKDYKQATFLQNFVASTGGAVASIVVSSPLDVIKTRIQNKNFGAGETGSKVLAKMIREEGFNAFFKGLVPKTAMVGPKLIFSFTIAQWLTQKFSAMGM